MLEVLFAENAVRACCGWLKLSSSDKSANLIYQICRVLEVLYNFSMFDTVPFCALKKIRCKTVLLRYHVWKCIFNVMLYKL